MHRSPAVVIVQKVTEQCTECGAACQSCSKQTNIELMHELEQVRAQLQESNDRIDHMDADFSSAHHSLEAENIRLLDELRNLNDKYNRLHSSYVKLQRLNHALETKLLATVENYELEKKLLNENVTSLNSRLLDAQIIICDLQDDLERCRSDCNVAVQLLHCKSSQFVEPQLQALPAELQQRVRSSVESADQASSSSQCPVVTVHVPVQSSLPRAAIVYSVSDPAAAATKSRLLSTSEASTLTVPTDALAKALTKPSVKPRPGRLVICSQCQQAIGVVDRSTQVTSLDNCRHADSPPANGFTSASSSKLSSVQRSQQLAVETRI